MAQKTRTEGAIEALQYRQRREQENRTLISAENTLNRVTFDTEGKIVYGNDGTIALSTPKN